MTQKADRHLWRVKIMAKKIKDENGNTYVQKKPFYKRVWFWILVVIVVAIGASMGGNKDKDTTAQDSSSKSASSASSSSAESAKVKRSDFDAVKIGDLMDSANGGDTLDALKQKFGEPESSSSSETNGIKTDLVTWDKVDNKIGSSMVISFTDGKAYSKDLTGFKLTRKNKIDLAQFNAIANGNAYTDIINKFGEPDNYTETLIGGEKQTMVMYTSGVKGGFGANFNVTFTNDVVSGKSQSDMK